MSEVKEIVEKLRILRRVSTTNFEKLTMNEESLGAKYYCSPVKNIGSVGWAKCRDDLGFKYQLYRHFAHHSLNPPVKNIGDNI